MDKEIVEGFELPGGRWKGVAGGIAESIQLLKLFCNGCTCMCVWRVYIHDSMHALKTNLVWTELQVPLPYPGNLQELETQTKIVENLSEPTRQD